MAIDLLNAARVAGWIGVVSTADHRTAVFCCKECSDAAMTQMGGLRRDLGKDRRKQPTAV